MKRINSIKISFVLLLTILYACNSPVEKLPREEVKQTLIKDFLELKESVSILYEMTKKELDKKALSAQFISARLTYKKIEPIVTFYYPEYSLTLNGAAIDKNDYHDINRKLIPASGFQVIEEILFSEEIDQNQLILETGILNGAITGLEKEIQALNLNDENIWQAIRLQVLRTLSLGLSGFDSPIIFNSLNEAKITFQTLKNIQEYYGLKPSQLEKIDSAIAYLSREDQDFNSFDRAEFIKEFTNPVAEEIFANQQSLAIPFPTLESAVDLKEAVFYSLSNFRPSYFAPLSNKETTMEEIELGKTLFFDPILSGNNQVSCASCHQPEISFADHNLLAIEGNGSVARNTPSLLYSGLQSSQFMDRRVGYLEDQAQAVLNNKLEMHGSFDLALEKLNQNPTYLDAFHEIMEVDTIKGEHLVNALASYIRSLNPNSSRFDQYLKGQENLTPDEIKGFNLFMGKGKCGTCHFFPLFNGGIPPFYDEVESEVLGVPDQAVWENAKLDEDMGEYEILKADLKKYAFKTPTVRNSGQTWPYMHNGVYSNLEEVLKFYNLGGGAGIGIDLPNQTLPTDPLNLSDEEINQIISFLHTLTDQPSSQKKEKPILANR